MLVEKSTVHFEITTTCNHRCVFCYNQHQVFDAQKNHEFISFEKYRKIIDILDEMKVKNVILTGGEPFLHPEIKNFIDYVKSKKLNVSINTNGTLLTPEINNFLSGKNIRLLVSMHATNGLFEKLVGANTFEKVIKNITNARKDYDLQISLQFVPLKDNYKHLYEVAELGKELGCYVQVGRYIDPVGINTTIYSMGLTIDEYHALFNTIIEIKEELKTSIGLGNGIPLCLLNEKSISNDMLNLFNRCGCSLGKAIWAINPKGEIRGCPNLENIIGNILTDSLEKISDEMNNRYNRDALVPLVCQNCNIQILCSGGCRASGLTCFGSLNSNDPLFPLDEDKRKNSIKLIEQKIKIIAGRNKEPLKKPLKRTDILKINEGISRRIKDEVLYLRGFSSKGFIYKELNDSAAEILRKFYKPNSIDNALKELKADYSIEEEEIKNDVFECVEELVISDILQFVK